jgi:cytochrome c
VRRTAFAAAILLGAVAAVGSGQLHPYGDPRAEPARGLGTLLQDADIPAPAKSVLIAKCADCHSNETRWPVYARIAPGSWLIERDIVQARKHLNLSQWNELPADRQQVLAAKIVQEAKTGDMPPIQYLALHWGAKLSTDDVSALSQMTRNAGQSEAASVGEGDAIHGKQLFERRCTGCHALQSDREGPRLAGIVGRRAGSVAGFAYSAGLKSSGLIWNDSTLEKWLTDPDAMVPENKMSFNVPKAQERRDIIAFLKR